VYNTEHRRCTLEISGRWELFILRTVYFVSPYIKRVTCRRVFSVTLCLPREVLLHCDDCHRRWFDTRQVGVKVFTNARSVTVSHFPLNWLYTWNSCLISTSLRHRDFVTFNRSKTVSKFHRTLSAQDNDGTWRIKTNEELEILYIIIFIDCNWVDTRWQWSFNMLHMHGLWRLLI
jgi:hypothetical protein